MISLLAHKHIVVINIWTLKRWFKKLCLVRLGGEHTHTKLEERICPKWNGWQWTDARLSMVTPCAIKNIYVVSQDDWSICFTNSLHKAFCRGYSAPGSLAWNNNNSNLCISTFFNIAFFLEIELQLYNSTLTTKLNLFSKWSIIFFS